MRKHLTFIFLLLFAQWGFAQVDGISPMGSLNIAKEVKPPILQLVEPLRFIEPSGNNAIDANETGSIIMKIKNTGTGDGINMTAQISATGSTNGLKYSNSKLATLRVGATQSIEFPISANMNVEDGTAEFSVQIKEPNGFGTQPYTIRIPTRAFVQPLVKVTSHSVESQGGRTLQKVSPFTLKVIVQNIQHGKAEDVYISIHYPVNVYLLNKDKETKHLSSLRAGENVPIEYQLIVNQEYKGEDIPIKISISEKYGKYAEDYRINLKLEQPIGMQAITINAKDKPLEDINIVTIGSDVDKDIPETTSANSNTYVMIIANQNYVNENKVSTALNDGRIMKEYCEKTLGIPAGNIQLREDQSYLNMQQSINDFAYRMKLNPGAKFLFFYFGHGMADPSPNAEDSYFLPIDGSSITLKNNGLSRNAMVATFRKENPKQLVIYLESCFSGATNTDEMLAYADKTSGLRISEKSSEFDGNIVIFSASSGAETANAYPSQGHNVFTYEFLKELKKTKGDCTWGELFRNVQWNTARTADREMNGKRQQPTYKSSYTLKDDWMEWPVK